MPDVRARTHRPRAALLAGAATLLLFALTGVASTWAAATPSQATTSTTAVTSTSAPAVLPTTTNAPLPQSGMNSGRLAGLAVSFILIGWGVCSFGEGVRLSWAPPARVRWAHKRGRKRN